MTQKVYAIRDIKADTFGSPVVVPQLGVLLRDLQRLVNDPQSQHPMSMYPQDFAVYQLGDYDDRKGQLLLLRLPDHVLNVESLVQVRSHAPVPGGLGGNPPDKGSEATAHDAVSSVIPRSVDNV